MAAKPATSTKNRASKTLKPLKKSNRILEGTQQSLCQALVPKVLFDACRVQMDTDDLTWRDVVRWALVEYLTARDPEHARKVWARCV